MFLYGQTLETCVGSNPRFNLVLVRGGGGGNSRMRIGSPRVYRTFPAACCPLSTRRILLHKVLQLKTFLVLQEINLKYN